MKKINLFCYVILFSFIPASLWADLPLSLKDCFKAALKRSEVLATQQELIVQAEQNYRKAWGAILPSINGTYTFLHQNAPGFISSGNTSTSAGQQTFTITADQSLFRGLSDFAALHGTKAFIKAQEQAKQWAGMQLYSDVAQAFYTRLAVQKDLSVLDNELELYQQRIKELQERLKIGRARITEVLTIQSAQAILKAQREQVLGQLDVAKEVLAFLSGLDQDIQLDDTDGNPPDPGPLDSYQSLVNARPDIIAAQKNVDAYQSNVSAARGAYLPTVDLISDYYPQRPDHDTKANWDVEIAVTLPIFTGGTISAKVKNAESQRRQSEIQLSLARRMAIENIRSLYQHLKADLNQMVALQEAFHLSQENYKANVKDDELNLVTNLDVLQAFISYQDTRRSLEKIHYQAKIDYNQLEASVAHRLSWMEESQGQ